MAGNHNHLHDIKVQFEVITATLQQADISVDGLFLNADTGFDSKNFREPCSKKKIHANIYISINVMEIQTEMNILTKIYIMSGML